MNPSELLEKLKGAIEAGKEKLTPMPPLSEELLATGRALDTEWNAFLERMVQEGAKLKSKKKRWWCEVEDFYQEWAKPLQFDAKTGVVSSVEESEEK